MSIPANTILAKLPVAKLAASLATFVELFVSLLPDARLKKVVVLAVQCILSCQTPVIAAMARSVSRLEANTWGAAKRMRRILALVLLAAQFVFFLDDTWPTQAVYWLRKLGGKLGLAIDRDGPYVLLRGLAAVWHAVAALTFLATHPFPHHAFPRVMGNHRRKDLTD